MSIGNTNTIAKIAAVVAGLGLVAMSFAVVPAKAATSVQDQIDALMAQLAALQAQQGGTSASMQFTADLTVGSTGASVTALQNWLISKGFSIPAGATGFFGPQTKAAVAAYQAANGITPAAGFFGPITRAKVNAAGGGTTGGSTGGTSTTLSGNGRLTNLDSAGDVESDIKEGDAVTKVTGVTAEATDGDVQVQRLDASFTISAGSNSSSLNRYVDSVSVYLDGKKLATMDAADGDKDGRVWTFRFTGLNGVIKKGDTGNLYVEVTPVSSIGQDEDGADVTASIPVDGVRAVGADGLSETYVSVATSDVFAVSSATTGTLAVSEGSSNPDDSVVKVDADTTTEDVTLMEFDLKAKKQDITVHDLPVKLVSTHAVSDTVQSLKLMSGSTVLKTKTISSSAATAATTTFDNIDEDISKDDTAHYSVVATIRKASGATFVSGDILTASTSPSSTWDVEDSNGDNVTPSGTATGGHMTLQTTGITVVLVGTPSGTVRSATVVGNPDIFDGSISFKVTAGDDDLYIEGDLAQGIGSPVAGTDGLAWATTTDSNTGTSSSYSATLSAADTNSADTTGSSATFKIPSGTSRTFTFSTSIPTGTDNGQVGVRITGIKWATTNSGDVLGNVYTSNLDTFKTSTKTGLNIL